MTGASHFCGKIQPVKRFSFLILFILMTSLACNTAQLGQGFVSSGNVLYQDDFTNPQSGWGTFDGEAGVAGYSDETYHIYIKSPNVNLWAHPGMDLGAVQIEMDTMTVSGPQENRIGLICRMRNATNFYYFVISDDGYYGIGKVKDGQWSLLGADQMRPSAAIQTGFQRNHLRADCIGDLLILYVNNQLVGSAKDDDFVTGDVGLLAGSFGTPGVDAYFDNFVVFRP